MRATLLKGLGMWLILVVVAIFNGALREMVLMPHMGIEVALPLSGVFLSISVFLVTFFLIPFIGKKEGYVYLSIGLLWVVLTLAFEFLFGHYVAGRPWSEIVQVLNIRKGDLFIVVLIVSAISPWLAAKARELSG